MSQNKKLHLSCILDWKYAVQIYVEHYSLPFG